MSASQGPQGHGLGLEVALKNQSIAHVHVNLGMKRTFLGSEVLRDGLIIHCHSFPNSTTGICLLRLLIDPRISQAFRSLCRLVSLSPLVTSTTFQSHREGVIRPSIIHFHL